MQRKRSAARGRVWRRRAAGLGLGLVLAVAALGGWLLLGPGGEEKPIVVGTTRAPTTVDPAGAHSAGGRALVGNVYQSLLATVPGRIAPVPDAARRCGFADARLTVYRCTLRGGLSFSNGDPITPEDVRFSYERVLAMAGREPSKPAAGPLRGLEAVRVAGRAVVFELSEPDAAFPLVVASAAGAIVDADSYDRHATRTDGRAVGSGPFLLADYEPGRFAELTPNPDYRGAARVPEHPVTIRYFLNAAGGPDHEGLARAWRAGELDVNGGAMPPRQLSEILISGGDGYDVHAAPGAAIRVLAFHSDPGNTDPHTAMADRAARRAAAVLLDRGTITSHVRHGTVEPLYSLIPNGLLGHGTPYYDVYEARADAEPPRLRRQLRDAGLRVPVPLVLAHPGGAASRAEAALIEAQLEADGLFEVTTRRARGGDARAADARLVDWAPHLPDPVAYTDLLAPSGGLDTGFSDPAVDALLDEARQLTDRRQAAERFRAIDDLVAEAAPVIPLWQARQATLCASGIDGAEHLAAGADGRWPLWLLDRA